MIKVLQTVLYFMKYFKDQRFFFTHLCKHFNEKSSFSSNDTNNYHVINAEVKTFVK